MEPKIHVLLENIELQCRHSPAWTRFGLREPYLIDNLDFSITAGPLQQCMLSLGGCFFLYAGRL
jgi:hypothetical protein